MLGSFRVLPLDFAHLNSNFHFQTSAGVEAGIKAGMKGKSSPFFAAKLSMH